MKKLLLSLPCLVALAACNSNTAHNTPTNTASASSQTAADGWRFSRAEMEDIANPDKLRWRIFYEKPSEGKDAAWFDAVKRGDFAKVKQMVESGQDLEAKDEAALGRQLWAGRHLSAMKTSPII